MKDVAELVELTDAGERVTAEYFAGLGFRGYHHFLNMHGGDATEGSIDFLDEEGDKLEEAIISGRQREYGWLVRTGEMAALGQGLELGLAEKYGTFKARLLAPVITKHTARRQIKDVAEGIKQDRPY